MSEVCQWCSNTSSAIDSLEHQIEQLQKERDILAGRCASMAQIINDFITEHCDREGELDQPAEATEQSCHIVQRAMLFMQRSED